VRRTGDRHAGRARTPIRGLIRWLGVDRNPLRRPADRFESAVRILLVLAFLGAGPVLAASVGARVGALGDRQARAERAWRPATAVLLRPAPQPYYPYDGSSAFLVPARWRLPSGAERTGLVAAPPGSPAGLRMPVWVDRAGRLTGHAPVTPALVTVRVVVAGAVTLAGFAVVLLLVASLVRWWLDRRRMSLWALEWALVGPRWTSRR